MLALLLLASLAAGQTSDCPNFTVLPNGDVLCDTGGAGVLMQRPGHELTIRSQVAQLIDSGPLVISKRSAVPVEQLADPFSRDLLWIGFGASADLLSTSAALHWCQTCAESNPLGWDAEARIALKLGLSTAGGTTCYWLRRHGHGKAATITRWLIFSIQAAATANNTIHAIRGR